MSTDYSTVGATADYDNAKRNYNPILDKLSSNFNIPWVEGDTDGQPALYIDGRVVVDFNKITADAPFHEFMHPLILLMEVSNPKQLDRLVREAQQDSKIVAAVDARYTGNDKNSREYRMELVATAVGEYAVDAIKAVEAKGLMAAIKEFLTNLLEVIQAITNPNYKTSIEQLSSMSLKEIGFVIGVNPPKLNLTTAQQEYKKLDPDNKQSVIIETDRKSKVDYLYKTFGYENVEMIRIPSNSDQSANKYKVRIYNPLSTKGKKLYRKIEKEIVTKTDNAFFNNLILAVKEMANSKQIQVASLLTKQEKNVKSIQKRYFENLVEEISRFTKLDEALQLMRSELGKITSELKKPQGLEDITASIKLLESFGNLTQNYNSDNTPSEVYDDIKIINTKTSSLKFQLESKLWDVFKIKYLENGGYEGVANSLQNSVRDINALSLQTIGSSFGQNGMEQAVDHIIRLNAHEMNQNRQKFISDLYQKLEAVGGSEDMSWMLDGEQIMLKTNPEFFTKMVDIKSKIKETRDSTREVYKKIKEVEREIINLQGEGDFQGALHKQAEIKKLQDEIRAIRMNGTTWSSYHKFMMQYFNYEMDETKSSHFLDDMEIMKELYYEEDANGNPTLNQAKFQKAVDNYNPEYFADFINGDRKYANEGWKYFKLVPKPETASMLTNPKYNSLSDSQKDFYDFFVEKFVEASEEITDISMNDDITHDMLIKRFMSEKDETLQKINYLQSATEWFKDLIATPEGANDIDVHGVYTGKNRKGLTYKPISNFLEKGTELSKQDILKAFEKFYDAGMTIKYKNKVSSLLEAGKELAATLDKLDFDGDGNMKTNLFGDPQTIKGQTKMAMRLEHMVENYLTKDVYEDFFGDIKVMGVKVTGERIIDLINDFTRYRQLGLNPFSGISNLAMGAINNWTYSKRAEFFNDDELRSAYFKLRGNTLRYVTVNKVNSTDDSYKIKLLADQIGITRNLLEKKYGNILDKAFTFQESGEFINQMAASLAVMSNAKTVEALIGPGKKLLDRNGVERNVLDLYKVDREQLILDNETFDLDALGITNIKMFNMSQAILKINKEIHGDYDQLNKMFLKRNALGRAVTTFRTWLPQAMMQRFGGERKDYQLTAFYGKDIARKGRYISVIDMYKDKGFAKSSMAMLGSFVTGFVPFVKGNINETLELGELDAANINQTLSELRIFTNLLIATTVMGKVSDEDDMEEGATQSLFNFMYNMTARTENELATFYYPTSSYKIFKDVIPAFDTMEQLADVSVAAYNSVFYPEKDIYKTGFRKGTSKLSKEIQLLLPVSKQAQNIWSTLNVQYAKTAYNR